MEKEPLHTAFQSQMKELLGDESEQFFAAIETEPKVSIRLNPFKNYPYSKDELQPIPWCKDAYWLPERKSFTLDPAFHAGAYYVQEASSMALDFVLRQLSLPENPIALDLCAAPGGKSTLLASFMAGSGLLIGNEVIKSRANILEENISKWGIGNSIVTQNDPHDFADFGGLADILLIDAPCSGEGLFRKDQAARKEWSPEHVMHCSLRQQRILDETAHLVAPNGYLVYSTCTYNTKENEDMVKFISSEFSYEPVRIPFLPNWGIHEVEVENEGMTFYGYKFFPHKVAGEGLFIAVFKRPSDSTPYHFKRNLRQALPWKEENNREEFVSSLILNADSYKLLNLEQELIAFPHAYYDILADLGSRLHLRKAGISLGKWMKSELQPAHPLALAKDFSHAYPIWNLSESEALQFLHKDELHPAHIEKGWVLVKYHGLSLGWLKNLGIRSNNYYPKEWRIRMDID